MSLLRYKRYLPNASHLELASLLPGRNYPPSSLNKLRPEHCPAVLDAARLGVLASAAEEEVFFRDNQYNVHFYPTRSRVTEVDGYDIHSPCLVGSDEASRGYYKIPTGVMIDTGSVGWLVTHPMDPRLSVNDRVMSCGYHGPGFRGPLFAIVKPEGDHVIALNSILIQLIPLSTTPASLEEAEFSCSVDAGYVEAEFEVRKDTPPITVLSGTLDDWISKHGELGIERFIDNHSAIVKREQE